MILKSFLAVFDRERENFTTEIFWNFFMKFFDG